MSSRFALRLAVFASCLFVAVAPTALAGPLDFVGQIGMTIVPVGSSLDFALDGGGTSIVNPSSPGLHLTGASFPADVLTVQHMLVPVTDPVIFPIAGVVLTAANASGVLNNASGHLQGAMPLVGVAKFCLFGPCSSAVANLVLPLTPIGQGGTAIVTAAVNLTVIGAPWTTGPADVGAATVHGSAHGPASATSSTAQLGGDLNLVTPIFISSNFAEARTWPGFARLAVHFGGLATVECSDGIDNDGDGFIDFPADPGCTKATDFSEHQSGHVCDDGIDNDGDGLVDFPADPGCTSVTDTSEAADCQDGLDNDGDGLVDFPADPGCTSANDSSERQAGAVCDDGVDNDGDGVADYPLDPGCTSPSDLTETGDCQDGIDNDGDGLVDFPADPGCTSASDVSERESTHICDDGIDNDHDGAIDFPADPGCSSPLDETESSLLACDDGIDNDHDGAIDFPADPGCASNLDDSERGPTYACDDGIDNDGDGVADFPDDRGCTSATGTSEIGECQDGVDNDGDGKIDFPADPDCSAASDPTESPLPACSDGIDNDGDGFIDYPADPECTSPSDTSETAAVRWEVAQGGNGHFYELVMQSLSWRDAKTAAAQRNAPAAGYGPGHLASISSAAEDAFLWSTLGVHGPLFGGWIGFTDEVVEGEWRWIDGTPGIWQDPDNFPAPIQTIPYQNWSGGGGVGAEPNNQGNEDYAAFGWYIDQWNDYAGPEPAYYVEWEPASALACANNVDDDGDGLVDWPNDPGCSSATDDSERDTSLICDDGIDNDGDGKIDFPADAGCTSPSDTSETTDCNDGIDNDGDGLVDFPADPGCTSASDVSERESTHICDDGIDNDHDGAIDFPADPGCSSPLDETESSLLACDDGIDNDGDGAIDFPADAGCASSLDDSERGPTYACDDGIDNDGDGVADFPDDPGCTSATGTSEVGQCQDGVDNDGDGKIDFPADPDCSAASDPTESPLPACSDGIDNDGDGLIDFPADPQCVSPEDISETAVVRWDAAQGGNGHLYELVNQSLSWPAARAAAAQRFSSVPGYGPGHLVSFSSSAEEAFVASAVGGVTGWIGFTDEAVEGEWRWIDATPGIWQDPDNFANPIQTAYVDWAPGEPNDVIHEENYALLWWSGIRWNDGSGNPAVVFPYYVEYEGVGPACSDNIDNDGDGLADYPNDPGCTSATDDSERDPSLICDDGIDNDGDGVADFPADPGCSGPSDGSEHDVALACDDGVDNDGDGLVDFPADPGCSSPSDRSEVADCSDGLDNDGDGLVDFPADPGCRWAGATSESPACNDGIDNDGDGTIDFDGGAVANHGVALAPPDPHCINGHRNSETTLEPCGLGAELVVVMPLLWRLRRRRRA